MADGVVLFWQPPKSLRQRFRVHHGVRTMKPLKLKPTFSVKVPLGPDEAIGEIRRAIRSPELQGHAVSAGHCVEFMIEKDDQRFWSPHLSVQVYEVESGPGAQLFGRFAPRPEIWTMFMFVYFLAAFGMCAAGVYGYVQWILGASPWAFVLIPVGLVTIVLLHVASMVGQGLSSDQMTLLRQRFDRAVEIAFESSSG